MGARRAVLAAVLAVSVGLLAGALARAEDPTMRQLVAEAWPGSPAVTTVDAAGAFGTDVSGLDYEGSGSATPGVMWAVANGSGTLLRLLWDGARWAPDTANGWAAGKALKYPNGAGIPDAEGVTLTAAGSAGGVFVASERDGANHDVSRPSVLRYDVAGASATLTATREWNLTADLPVVDKNEGLESITWVPDTYLTGAGFFDEAANAAYSPATYPDHGSGLFIVGLEATGTVYVYALDQSADTFTRVATFATGFATFAGLHWDTATDQLWVACDNQCDGRVGVFAVDSAAGPTQGRFVASKYYERPTGMADLNNEGFTMTPASECAEGGRPVIWADDGNTDGHALRAGTVSCGTPAPTPTTTATPTATATPRAKTCKVPRLKGLGLRAAKRKIRAAGCRVGTVSKRGRGKLRVVRQRPKAGRRVARGTRVKLRLRAA